MRNARLPPELILNIFDISILRYVQADRMDLVNGLLAQYALVSVEISNWATQQLFSPVRLPHSRALIRLARAIDAMPYLAARIVALVVGDLSADPNDAEIFRFVLDRCPSLESLVVEGHLDAEAAWSPPSECTPLIL